MKKEIKLMVLLSVLTVAAVGCQKEKVIVEPNTSVEASHTVYTVRYSVNGVLYTETLIGEQAWADFLQRMMALAEEGYRVTVSRNTDTKQYAVTKEVVTFKTKSKDEAYAWMDQKVEEGYIVTIEYNEQTKEYNCTAIK